MRRTWAATVTRRCRRRLTKRFSQGVSLLATYTWSKTLDTAGGLLVNGRLNRGIADYDRTHVATIGLNAQLAIRQRASLSQRMPAGRVDLILGGWELGTVTLLQSGLAITPTLVNNSHLNADVSGASLRPDRVPGVDPYDVPGGQIRELSGSIWLRSRSRGSISSVHPAGVRSADPV